MVEELPTQKQLEQLLEKKGKDALAWYVWRNILRALPLLGHIPLTKVWPEDTLQHSIAVLRIPFVIINYSMVFDAADYYADTDDHASADAHNSSIAAATDDATDIATAAAYSTYSTYSTYAETIAYAIYIANPTDLSSIKNDYIFLMESNLNRFSDYGFSRPLWSSSFKEYQYFNDNCNNLYKDLNELGLDFIAEDLQRLWSNESSPIQPYWKNYSKKLSVESIKSAESYREAILGETADINAIRILILGPGGAGKTTLADRLKNKPIAKQTIYKPATIGVDYFEHQPLVLTGKKSAFVGLSIPENLQLYLWDFGGQTLFYGLHKSFLHENCVYILVVDSRHEQAPDEWLQQIQHLIGDKASPPILIISNEYENCYRQQNEQRLRREFPTANLQFFNFPCNQNNSQGLQHLKKKLLKIADQSRYAVPKSLFNATQQIENIFKRKVAIDLLELEEELKDYIHYDIKTIIKQLEGLGRIVNIEGNHTDERYCLNPTWVVDHAYSLLYLECLRQSNGVILSQDLKREANQYFNNRQEKKDIKQVILNYENINDLLKFLQKSRVCKLLKGKRLFFPDLAAANEPKKIQKILQNKEEAPSLVEFHLPYLPISLAAYLVCRWLENNEYSKVIIKDIGDVWREGFILSHQQFYNNYLIVQYQPRKAVLLVYCFGEQAVLLDLLDAIWQGLIEEIKPINAKDILFFVRINRDFSEIGNHFVDLNQRARIKRDKETIETLKTVIGDNMGDKIQGDKTVVQGGNVQISKGDYNNLTQNIYNEVKVSKENRDKLIQEAINLVRNKNYLSGRQSLQLAKIQIQIDEHTADDAFYHQLRVNLGTVADVFTIASTIGAMIGLA